MKVDKIRKVKLFKSAFKLGFGWTIGVSVGRYVIDCLYTISNCSLNYMIKHRDDDTIEGEVYRSVLDLVGIKLKK